MNNDLHYQTAVDLQQNTIGRLQYLNWGEFTGCVDITCDTGQAWEIVFYQGQIAWSLDLTQPNRLWQRLLCDCLSYKYLTLQLLLEAANHAPFAGFKSGRKVCWQYQGAIALLNLAEIKDAELTMMLEIATQETIFDLLQYSQGHKLTFQSHSEAFAMRPPVLVNTEKAIERGEVLWQEWCGQKLGIISPSKTPIIRHPVQLYRQTTPIIYQNLVQVITGKRTLREIAVEINEDLLLLTRSLTRYIQTGIIELIDLPDLPTPILGSKILPTTTIKKELKAGTRKLSLPRKPAQSKLVICIDDSPQVCELMRAIVTEAGYRFIAIQDPIQALPRLLENKPDLIFLDLMMPKINGYEICGQIRRVSTLVQVPVVVLTGKDGLLDRVRAKVVGASEFTCKPITKLAIDASLNKYLNATVRET